MNRSWRNTSNNSSTGFVYFNTSNSNQSPNTVDTPDFLSFGSDSSPGSSPHGNQFSPSNFSSPSHYYGKSPRQRGNRNQYYSPIKQNGGKFWRRNLGLTGSAEKIDHNRGYNAKHYHHINESQGNQNKPHQTNRGKRFQQNAPNQSFNASAFYDPTCLKDPWTELEEKLVKDKKKERDSLVEAHSSQSMSQSMEAEMKEASSDESESEDNSDETEESFS